MKEKQLQRDCPKVSEAREERMGKIPDEFAALLGYNKNYTSYLLSNYGKIVNTGHFVKIFMWQHVRI